MSGCPSLDSRLYRAALYLCPPAFRREFAGDMTRDFDDARRDALAEAIGGRLWQFRALMAVDLARTVAREWLTSAWPFVVLAAIVGPLAITSLLARFWRPVVIAVPAGAPDADLVVLELLVAVVFFVVASTIIFTLTFARIRQPRRRR
jgi:hypothetical protein